MKTLVGLTGNIGCGKSTVAKALVKFIPCEIIDCDIVARNILMLPQHRAVFESILGFQIYKKGGSLDSVRIASVIFSDDHKKNNFEAVLHPYIFEEVDKISEMSPHEIIIVESAIIYDIGWNKSLDAVLVAHCPVDVQKKRLLQIRKMDPKDAGRRIQAQLSQREKISKADFLIDTNCTLDELEKRVQALSFSFLTFHVQKETQ